jgi:hypothetical protein
MKKSSPCPSCDGYNTECRICYGHAVSREAMNSREGARLVFGGHVSEPTYLGVPVRADFPLNFDSLAPYVTAVLDLAAPIEGSGRTVEGVEIKDSRVKVW